MPRRLRRSLQGAVFHVMNRAVRRTILFETDSDYAAFIRVVCEALLRFKVRIISYSLMPNHWHLVVICESIKELSKCMHWLQGTHANRWNGAHGTRGRGAVYQGRFKAVPVQKKVSVRRVCRYVERNALRKGLVARAEDWRWSSLYALCKNCDDIPLGRWPIPRPSNWIEIVNTPESPAELDALRDQLRRNHPIGTRAWAKAVAPFAGLTLRRRGGQRK
jgi:putative transposase